MNVVCTVLMQVAYFKTIIVLDRKKKKLKPSGALSVTYSSGDHWSRTENFVEQKILSKPSTQGQK